MQRLKPSVFAISHWQTYPSRMAQIEPPLRPDNAVIAEVKRLVGGRQGPILLLGVTPELAHAFDMVQAVDKNPAMVESVWPGDTAFKKARVGDWLQLEQPDGSFPAVIGDGSLNNLTYPDDISRLIGIVVRLLSSDGLFACRLFERPTVPITTDAILAAPRSPDKLNFHALKWMLAMQLAAERGANVPVTSILRQFDDLFPDRDALSRETGWTRAAIDTIDAYRGSPLSYCFPDRTEFISTLQDGIADIAFRDCGNYPLASCCPILTFRKT